MANTGQLSANGTSGMQGGTRSPQNSTQATSLGQSQNVQTGTATNLLNNHNGVTLHDSAVPTVSLGSASVKTAPPTPISTHHGPNPVVLSFSVVLFVVAIGLFWSTTKPEPAKAKAKAEKPTKSAKSVKKTTKKR